MKHLDELNKKIIVSPPPTPDKNGVRQEILRDLENDYNIWRRKVESWKSSQNENN
jgi:hypothetical protein